MGKRIYLDNAATTPIKKEVIEAMKPYLTDVWYNPNSIYKDASVAKEAIETARKDIAKKFGVKPDEIYFTSGGSESNCWAIQGFVKCWETRGYTPIVITSSIEHDSVLSCVSDLNCQTWELPVDRMGLLAIEALEAILWELSQNKSNRVLVSIQDTNNEIGTRQAINTIADIVHSYGYVLHSDMVQSTHSLDDVILKTDMASFSGHKFGAPKGVGFLYKKDGVDIHPLIYGTQNHYMRGGTENVASIVGMAKAFADLKYDANDIAFNNARIAYKMRRKGIRFKVNGQPVTILNVTLAHQVSAEALIHTMDISGIQISAGSACNAHEDTPSHVLLAIGCSEEDAMRTIRISPSAQQLDDEDVDYVVDELANAIMLLTGEKIGE